MKILILSLVIFAGFSVMAGAFAATVLGKFKEWTAFVFDEPEGKMCAAISEPVKSKYSRPIKGRGPVQFYVARFPGQGDSHSEPSTAIGYPFAEDAKIAVEIDGESKFTMFTQRSFAWLPDEADRSLVNAMRQGKEMMVEGKSQRGTITTDTYSLMGISAALDAIKKKCP